MGDVELLQTDHQVCCVCEEELPKNGVYYRQKVTYLGSRSLYRFCQECWKGITFTEVRTTSKKTVIDPLQKRSTVQKITEAQKKRKTSGDM